VVEEAVRRLLVAATGYPLDCGDRRAAARCAAELIDEAIALLAVARRGVDLVARESRIPLRRDRERG
jgi:hypothetical protein